MIAFNYPNQVSQDEGVQLMLELQAGDRRALETLASKYSPLIAAVVTKLTGSDEWVDDVTQEVLVRVLQSSDRYHPTAKLSTWLALITRNLVFNMLRDRRNRRTYTVDFHQADGSQVTLTAQPEDYRYCWCPQDALEIREACSAVRSAVKELIPRQRRAVELVYFRGLSYAQAAGRLQTSPAALKALLARARSQLKRSLSD